MIAMLTMGYALLIIKSILKDTLPNLSPLATS